jgi:type I restriction-modification system DNA methylase subunit
MVCCLAPARPTRKLRRTLVEEHFLEGVVSLPSGVFRPYAGVSTAILFFTKTGRGPRVQETNQISSVRPRGRNTLPSFDSSDKMELVASSHGR